MTEIGFYHLTRTPLDRALPQLLGKAQGAGLRAVVLAGSAEMVAHLDHQLWTFDPASFLPHGTAADGDSRRQPIYLTETDGNASAAEALFLVDGAETAQAESFQRILDLFDGHDEAAVAAARRRWKAMKDAGHQLTYWQQTDSGGWEKKVETGGEGS